MEAKVARRFWSGGVVFGALLGLLACGDVEAGRVAPGSWVDVSVDVSGRRSPLFSAPDGSGRFYFEAKKGTRYSLRVRNRSSERLGVKISVDGLNVISGELDRPGPRGRMYILNPWQDTVVKGWRTSLKEVRRFTFVDEARSYAARSGQATSKLGWVELEVYREKRPRRVYADEARVSRPKRGESRDRAGREEAPRAAKSTPQAAAESDATTAEGARSYPGTGWGRRTHDRAVLVDFRPHRRPVEKLTLRYEYKSGLRALGILPTPPCRDRLAERDSGFAQPPRW